MPMTPATLAEAAIRRARRAPQYLATTTTSTGSVVIDPGDGRGALTISVTTAGHALLIHRRPTGGLDRTALLAQADAVEAAAAWIDGADLPPSAEPEPIPPAAQELYDRAWDAVLAGMPEDLDYAKYPSAGSGVDRMSVGGPEGARLDITPRLDADGALTGAAWQGRRAAGSSIAGHGSPEAAIRAAAQWASTLDERLVIPGTEAQARREATGATQADLARLMGVRPHTISRWESGARAPRNPVSYLVSLQTLEAWGEELYQQALDEGRSTGVIPVWDTDRDYWAASPDACLHGIPAAVHRVAAARAQRALAADGVTAPITPGPTGVAS